MDKGAKVKAVTNENGQIIKVTRGYRFEQMDIKPMSSTPFNQLNNLNRYMQDIGAAQEALLGRAPTGVSAAKAFEELVANAYINFADLADNLVITLEELGAAVLEMGSRYMDLTYDFKAVNKEGQTEVKKVIGQQAMGEGALPEDVVPIPTKAMVKVVINSGVAYTKSGRQDVMFRLRSSLDVDRKTMLETIGLDAEQVEQRLKEEKEEEAAIQLETQAKQMEMQQSMMPQQGQPSGPQGSQGGQGAPEGQQLSDEAIQFVSDLEAQGMKLSEEFMADPSLIEALVKGELDSHVMPDGTVMPGPEM
jgi:hypothetical protein